MFKIDKLLKLLSCVLFFALIIGCSDNIKIPGLDSLQGTWEIEKIEPYKKEYSESLLNARITFSKSGEVTTYTVHKDANGTITKRDTMNYWTEYDKLFMDSGKTGEFASFRFENNRLIIKDPVAEVTAYFVRVKN